MRRETGGIILVAGTCIGSGMIALPMVLSRAGILLSSLLMLAIWYFSYYTSLITLELNLQAKEAAPLGSLARLFSGKIAQIIGVISLKLLSYSLLAVYIHGGASILQKLFESNVSLQLITGNCAILIALMLLLPVSILDRINRFFFATLLLIITALTIALLSECDLTDLPLLPSAKLGFMDFSKILPILFTSFGFQVIFHTITNYCSRNSATLKRVFLFGSLIAAIAYIIWTYGVLSALYHNDKTFYLQMSDSTVGDLIAKLSVVTAWPPLQKLVWLASVLAIITSTLGVGIGLYDGFKTTYLRNLSYNSFGSAILTVFPAYLIAILIPNAFLAVLGVAGMILTIIAILLPVYLLQRSNFKRLHYYKELRLIPLIISFVAGVAIVICELINISS